MTSKLAVCIFVYCFCSSETKANCGLLRYSKQKDVTSCIRDCKTDTMKSLEAFGYAFNNEGELRKLDPITGLPGNDGFDFNISKDHNENQKNYELLGETITQYVYDLLRNEVGCIEYPIPINGNDSLKTFVFGTDDILSNTDKLIILIHGSGVVRAGQWARSLIINNNLKSGTQIPYIEKAKQLGYAVLITNTNDNTRFQNNSEIPIPYSSSPEEHASYVWQHYVLHSKAKFVAVVAHSYGGVVCLNLAEKYMTDFNTRVGAIAMTDSVHVFKRFEIPTDGRKHLRKIGVNWVSSSDPLDKEQLSRSSDDIPQVSAGTERHEMTSYSCMESVFEFIEKRYKLHVEELIQSQK